MMLKVFLKVKTKLISNVFEYSPGFFVSIAKIDLNIFR